MNKNIFSLFSILLCAMLLIDEINSIFDEDFFKELHIGEDKSIKNHEEAEKDRMTRCKKECDALKICKSGFYVHGLKKGFMNCRLFNRTLSSKESYIHRNFHYASFNESCQNHTCRSSIGLQCDSNMKCSCKEDFRWSSFDTKCEIDYLHILNKTSDFERKNITRMTYGEDSEVNLLVEPTNMEEFIINKSSFYAITDTFYNKIYIFNETFSCTHERALNSMNTAHHGANDYVTASATHLFVSDTHLIGKYDFKLKLIASTGVVSRKYRSVHYIKDERQIYAPFAHGRETFGVDIFNESLALVHSIEIHGFFPMHVIPHHGKIYVAGLNNEVAIMEHEKIVCVFKVCPDYGSVIRTIRFVAIDIMAVVCEHDREIRFFDTNGKVFDYKLSTETLKPLGFLIDRKKTLFIYGNSNAIEAISLSEIL